MGTLGRIGDQLASGWEGAKQGVQGIRLSLAAGRLDAAGKPAPLPGIDEIVQPTADPGPTPEQAAAARDMNVREIGAASAAIGESQKKQQSYAVNPASEQMRGAINEGKYGKAFGAFASDPVGVLGQLTVQGLPSAAPMMAAGAVGGLAAGPLGALAGTFAGAYGTDIGPRTLGYLTENLQHAGVDPSDPAAMAAAIQANPGLVTDAATKAGRASLAPAMINTLLGGASRGFLPGRGTGYNVGVLAGNTGIHLAGQPVAEAGAQLAGTGEVHDPAAVVDAGLGAAPLTAFHTLHTTFAGYKAGTFRPGETGLGGIHADGGPAPGGAPGGAFGGAAAAILGFPTSIEQAEANYRAAARRAHPDVAGGSQEAMAALNDAISQARTHFEPVATAERNAPQPAPEEPAPAPQPAPPEPQAPAGPTPQEAERARRRQELHDILADPRSNEEVQADIERQAAERNAPAIVPEAPAPQPGGLDQVNAEPPAVIVPPAPQPPVAAPGADPAAPAAAQDEAPPLDYDTHARAMVEDQAHQAADPTPAQAEAGNYQKGHIVLGGLDISIETPAGADRRGIGKDGQPWSNPSPADYGYIKRTVGADGDQVDVYLGPDAHRAERMPVFVVDQIDPATGKFDEHKALLGFPNEAAARAVYEAGFGDGSGAHRHGAMTTMGFKQFARWAKGDSMAPLAYQPQKPLAPRARPQRATNTLLQFLASKGGITDPGGDLAALEAQKFMPGHGMVVREGGMKLDRAREQAEEAGFLPPNSTINDLLDAIHGELHGRPSQRLTDQAEYHIERQQLREEASNERFAEHRAEVDEAAADYGLDLTESEKHEATTLVAAGHVANVDDALYTLAAAWVRAEDARLARVAAADNQASEWAIPWDEPEEQTSGKQPGEQPTEPSREPAGYTAGSAGERDPPGAQPGDAARGTGSEGAADVPEPRASAGQGADEPGQPAGGDAGGAEGGAAPVRVDPAASAGGGRPAAEADQTRVATSRDYGTVDKPNVPNLARAFEEYFAAGNSFASIAQARLHAAKVLGGKVAPGSATAKAVDEAVELGIVRRAQRIAAVDDAAETPPVETFEKLVKLYDQQPKLGTRTSGSIERQAYSTPPPLAYVANVLADMTGHKPQDVYEPTAGNGSLLMLADTRRSTVNELDPDRAANLRSMGFRVTTEDATKLEVPAKSQDVVIANPPFGVLRGENGQPTRYDLAFVQPGYSTNEIDHAIALRSLEAMKDDGRAVLILGGINKLVTTPEGRGDAYNGKAKREFFFTLYGKYNVVDHFTAPGQLYERMGAGWPVDVIVIHGRGKSALSLPSQTAPRIVPSWDAMKEVLNHEHLADQGHPPSVGDAGKPAAVERADQPGGLEERDDAGRLPVASDGARGVDAGTGGEPAAGSGGAGGRDGGGRDVVGTANVPEPAGSGGRAGDEQSRVPASAGADDGAAGREPVPGAPDAAGVRSDQGDQPGRVDEPGVPSVERRSDDVAAAFDDAFADVFGEEPAKAPTVGEAAASAAKNTLQAADAAMDALTTLFGNKDRLGSGPSFDEETWAKAKPLFQAAIQKFKAAGADIKAMLVALMRELRDVRQWTAEMVQNARPYLERFAREWKPDEAVNRTAEKGEEITPKAPADKALETVKPQKEIARPKEAETATQVAYEPSSKVRSVGTLVPTNLRTAIGEALQNLEKDVGPIDTYVEGKLGYEPGELGDYYSAEQVDALALGIRQIDDGKGFVIGDQTGVGKGRFVAGLIRYAMNKGLTPVFVTEKPNLYGDMVRDLTDIGMPDMAGKVLVTNGGLSLPLSDDPKGPRLKTPPAREHDAALRQASEKGGLPAAYSAVFTTYSQMQQIAGQETPRMRLMRNLAPNAFLILDEAHNAGGTPDSGFGAGKEPTPGKATPIPRSKFFREIVNQSKSVAYSSATWAKRPDVLDLYGAKTDMREAVSDLKMLADTIKRGGVPMQQIVTAQLASVGQYTRRERSFAGVTYDLHEIETDREAYDKIAGVLARIYRISDEHMKGKVKEIGNDIRDAAKTIGGDGAVGSAGATSTGFGSVMHNLINQMLLASKAKGTVDLALSELKAGRKPVIALANTMGSFIAEFAEETGASPGDAIDLTFNNLLNRYLKRTLRYSERKPFMAAGEKAEIKTLTPDQLGPEGLALYRETEAMIAELELGNMPVSPIDYIRSELAKAGYKVGEITGRTEAADYREDGRVYYRTRSGKETSPAGRMAAIRGFNGGDLDAMILNQSGATGLSLHASEKVKDQRKRTMLIAQAEANIDTHMQMLGRVHRTGQVVTPGYLQLVANVPAEQRPAAVLANKMASLSASTTANRKGGLGSDSTPDFINKYGGQVIGQMLREDPELDRALGKPRGGGGDDEEGDSKAQEDADAESLARKVTGRIPLLPLARQEEVYAEIEERYKRLIQELDEAGTNGLEAKTLDLDARTLSSTELTEGKGTNPFTSSAQIERMDVKRSFIPPAPEKIVADLARNLEVDGHTEADTAGASPADLAKRIVDLNAEHGRDAIEAAIGNLETGATKAAKDITSRVKDAEKRLQQQERMTATTNRIKSVLREAEPGSLVEIKIQGDLVPETGLVLGVKQRGKSLVAPSSWEVEVLTSTGMRRQISLANLYSEETKPLSDPPEGMQVLSAAKDGTVAEFLAGLAGEAGQTREERSMVTGNILAGYAKVHGEGQIVNYTDSEGATRQGVLLPKKWDQAAFTARQAQVFSPENAITWLRRGGEDKVPPEVHTPGNQLRIARDDRGNFVVTTASSKEQGGAYFLDGGLRRVTGDLVKAGDRMRARVEGWKLPDLMRALTPILAREGQNLVSDHPQAKAFAKDDLSLQEAPSGWGSVDAGPEQTGAGPEERQAIIEATQKIVGPNIEVKEIEGALFRVLPDGKRADIGGLSIGRLIAAATGPYFGRSLSHEAIHALRNLGVIGEGEWKTLEAAAVSKGWLAADEKRGNYAPEQRTEEAIAEAFAAWSEKGAQAPAGMIGRAWAKVRRFMEALRNAVAGRGLRTAEGVFERICSGEIGAREPGSRAEPMRAGNETIEQSRARVNDMLVKAGILGTEVRVPVDTMLAALQELRDAPPETLAARLGATVRSAPVIGAAAVSIATHATDLAHTVQMMVAPMAHGGASDEARAIAKDFANARRLVRWAGNRSMEDLTKRFTPDQLNRMWVAADKESVARQTGSTTRDGLNTLDPEEREEVEALQALAATVFRQAFQVGIHQNENPLPSYVPRMVVDIADPDASKQAHIVKDIRTLVLATMKLQEAIIGRQLINQIRGIGNATGGTTVHEGGPPGSTSFDPMTGISTTTSQMRHRKHLEADETEAAAQRYQHEEDGFRWFTIDSPAFKTAKYKGRNEEGEPIFETVPIYVRGDFEGPLRAVMRKPDGLIYRALMDLKGRIMTAIMYGVAHLGVVAARTFEYNPNIPGAIREGAVFRQDVAGMRRAINGGLVPMGKQGALTDARGIEAAMDPKPGRSWTSQILAFGPGLVSPKAADVIKRGADAFGDVTHGWMWEQVANIQTGVYARMERKFLASGATPEDAARQAARIANVTAGAVPEEATSQWARKIANVALFSFSYRTSNLQAVKDAFLGLPKDVRAQLKRSGGEAAMLRAVKKSRKTAAAALAMSLALTTVGNSMLQSAINVLALDKTISSELQGYGRRLSEEFHHLTEDPVSGLNLFSVLHSLTPMHDHEPGKQNRLLVGFEKDGTGVYLRNPLGKFAEDIQDYFVQPIKTLHSMMSPYGHAVDGLWTGRNGMDQPIYDKNPETTTQLGRAIGDYVAFVLQGAGPTSAISAAKDLVTGETNRPGFAALQIAGGAAGMSFSHGGSGGPIRGEMRAAKERHEFEVQRAMPAIRKLLSLGKQTEAVTELRRLGVPQGLMRYYIQQAANPAATPSQIRKVLEYATPEQRERILGRLNEGKAASP
jgi:predicted RNA methylase